MAATQFVVIEPETLFRDLLCQALGDHKRFVVVAQAADAASGRAAVLKHKPHTLVIEPRLQSGDGLQLIRDVLAETRTVRVVILTAMRDSTVIRSLLESGIHGFIEKNQRLEEVLNALARVAEQGRFYSPLALDVLSNMVGKGREQVDGQISERERQILVLLARGLTTREIARELSISQFTAKTHRQNIYLKLGINKATALTRFAIEKGWVFSDRNGSIQDPILPGRSPVPPA